MKIGLTLLALLTFATMGSLQAQLISWDPTKTGAITNDSDVLTNGSYFDATQLQYDHATAETVNGVVFHAFNGANSDGTISLSNAGEGGDAYYGPNTLSASYQEILTNPAYQDAGQSGSVTIGSLSLTHDYQVQIWLAPASDRSTVYSGVTPIALSGAQYAVGDFTALTSSLTFTFQSNAAVSSPYGEIYAISVRDITTAPEPSTWALMLGGVVVLALGTRRKILASVRA